ncbi:MAG: hypothetical protein RL344_638 [Pseudomonadota bacterium]|jgi:hypothetical protein
MGDIVGRDLDAFGVSAIGHVGMWTGDSVLEVLNESSVIQLNNLTNFKQRSAYWGARYGKGYNQYTMVLKGWDQRNYRPSYTYTAQYSEGGKYERKCKSYYWHGGCGSYGWVMSRAVFRCDTFVNYMYLKGTNTNLVSITSPAFVYNAMPYSR